MNKYINKCPLVCELNVWPSLYWHKDEENWHGFWFNGNDVMDTGTDADTEPDSDMNTVQTYMI